MSGRNPGVPEKTFLLISTSKVWEKEAVDLQLLAGVCCRVNVQ